MHQLPNVDITILSWDRIDDTLKAIDSAVSQQGINKRVIVVDQGSQAEGLARLRHHCRGLADVILVCNEHNLGVPGGRNVAARQGDGEFIVALDNDAEFIDEFQLAKAAALMLNEPTLAALAFRILRFGSAEDDHTSWSYHQDMHEWADQAFYTDRFVGAGHMFRRDVFDKIGGYDASLFFLHEEVDLSKRFINAGYTIKYTPEVVIGHKVSAEHRVAWTGGRWQFDVRNRTYLHIKHKTFFPTFAFHTGLMIWRGIRSGLWISTFRGLIQSIAMIPSAFRAWRLQPEVSTTPESRQYLESCSPMQGLTVWQRAWRRLRTNKPVPVKAQG